MTRHALPLTLLALALAGLSIWGIARLPTAFIPIEDQGYMVVIFKLPNGAALEWTQRALDEAAGIARAIPGVADVIEIVGISVLDNNASLPSAGAVYVLLDDWSKRGRGTGRDLRSLYQRLQSEMDKLTDATGFVVAPPPIQGIGNASGFTMMAELRDGSNDFLKLQRIARTIIADGSSQSELQRLNSPFRAGVPQLRVLVDRVKAETLHVSVNDVFATLTAYIGSAYVNQFNKFGRTFQVYVQADSQYRLQPSDLLRLYVRSQDGNMVPLGALVTIEPDIGPSLIDLYNLYPAATIVGASADGFSSGEALSIMDEIAEKELPRGTGSEWTAMSYQEKAVGAQIYIVFGLGLLLVYLCLAAQYESWLAPLAVVLAVPLSLSGPGLVLGALGVANNLYVQIGLVLLTALSAKNAILIVEVARERRLLGGLEIIDAAAEAAQARFRPIVMTSSAFILGVVPLVTSSGAGASARISLGLSVLTGMTASTCLAVLLVPSFVVVLRRVDERLTQPRRSQQPLEVKS